MVCLEQLPGAGRRNWKTGKWAEESKPFRLQHCWHRLEYWEESWRPEETCCHSDQWKPTIDASFKTCKQWNINTKTITDNNYTNSIFFKFWYSRGWPEGSLFDSLLHQGVGEGATPFPGLLHFTLDPYLIMLSVKQGGIKYHFLSLWYDSTWDWTQVSRAIGEHSNR